MTPLRTALALVAGLSLALAACGGGEPAMSELEAVQTIAAATAVMGITQTAAALPPSPTPEPPTATPTQEPPTPTLEPPTNTPDATAASLFSPTPGLPPVLGAPPTSTPGGQPAGSCSYAAAFEGVETIPDGTQYPFGTAFTKTWRIKNTGTCTWDGSLNLIWVYSETDGQSSSELMGAQGVIAIVTSSVPPNGYLDINVDFVTPSKAGTYRVEFKLRSSSAIFGVNGNGTLWVEIEAYDPGGGPAPTPTP